jgi:hypothetical protein
LSQADAGGLGDCQRWPVGGSAWRVGRRVAARTALVVRVLVSIAAGEREEQQRAAAREGHDMQHREQDHELGVSAHHRFLVTSRGSR